MAVTHDKLLVFNSHDCSSGLSDEELTEISDAADLVEYELGDCVLSSNHPMTSVNFIVNG